MMMAHISMEPYSLLSVEGVTHHYCIQRVGTKLLDPLAFFLFHFFFFASLSCQVEAAAVAVTIPRTTVCCFFLVWLSAS